VLQSSFHYLKCGYSQSTTKSVFMLRMSSAVTFDSIMIKRCLHIYVVQPSTTEGILIANKIAKLVVIFSHFSRQTFSSLFSGVEVDGVGEPKDNID